MAVTIGMEKSGTVGRPDHPLRSLRSLRAAHPLRSLRSLRAAQGAGSDPPPLLRRGGGSSRVHPFRGPVVPYGADSLCSPAPTPTHSRHLRTGMVASSRASLATRLWQAFGTADPRFCAALSVEPARWDGRRLPGTGVTSGGDAALGLDGWIRGIQLTQVECRNPHGGSSAVSTSHQATPSPVVTPVPENRTQSNHL